MVMTVMVMMAMMLEMTAKAMAEDRGVDEDGRWQGSEAKSKGEK